ncbi:MAG: U32 family peptidase [Oliverpabstia sp.]|nr:U32 family peptidase [Oliverpabstia sp.]
MDIELLAPAGSYEALEAAFRAGADAVYLGGQKFGARAYAENLDRDQMIQAIETTHLHGKKLYLTVNTLLKNKEMERELYDYLVPYYEAGLDAVIVQDLGVLTFIKTYFPDIHIHASTQMTITGSESARLLKEAGASRVVTARELSLEEIRKIYQETHMEIESFVHGALCYCYSGQCLMSSLFGGRSGNRGRCAQPCRLPYQVYREGKQLNDAKTGYPLSPKDMCTVGILPQILEAGVHSLKIEGRMKKPEYTAGVVEIYRKYLDRYLEGEKNPIVSKEDYQILLDIYNRDGFHESYYNQRNGRQMMALRNEKKSLSGEEKKKARNEKLFEEIRKKYLSGKKQEKIKGTLSLFPDCPAILEIEYGSVQVTAQGEMVQTAANRPLEEDRIRKQMMKTGETEFVFDTLDIFMGERIFLPVQQLNELRRQGIELLENAVLQPLKRKALPRSSEVTQRKEEGRKLPGMSASVVNCQQLKAVLEVPGIERIYADCGMFPVDTFYDSVLKVVKDGEKRQKECYLMLPHMVRDRELKGRKESFHRLVENGLCGFVVRNMESYGILKQMGLEKKAILDFNLYTMNDESQKFWKNQGILWNTIPLELNSKELRFRDNRSSEMMVYGYIPLMISVQCLQKNLDHCNKQCAVLTVKDRYQKEFHAVCNCEFCYNTIYNSLPLSLLGDADQIRDLDTGGYRLSFTLENEEETKRIAREFVAVYCEGREPKQDFLGETTRGHFGRGVE